MAAPVNNSAWLEWMSSLMGERSRQTYAATFPPDLFYCLLDELPLHLVPQAARKSLRVGVPSSTHLILNPDCILFSEGEAPEEFARRRELLSGFAMQGTIAWVRDSERALPVPFWLGPESDDLLHEVSPGQALPRRVPERLQALLVAAKILIPRRAGNFGEAGNAERTAEVSARFRQKGYAPLQNLIHPFHVAALRRYYRQRIRSGAIPLGDRQSARRYAVHNDPVARFFHHQITAAISAVAGEELKPSYVYMASYLSGAELKQHLDREQCEYSVTLCLDYSPEPALATPWPIHLKAPGGTVTVYQALGDGLAYRGTRLPHYRRELQQGHTSTSIFFHYVASDFTGSLQ